MCLCKKWIIATNHESSYLFTQYKILSKCPTRKWESQRKQNVWEENRGSERWKVEWNLWDKSKKITDFIGKK